MSSLNIKTKKVHFIILVKKYGQELWKTHKTRYNGEDWPYLKQRVRLDREEYKDFLFQFYLYLHHNLDILANKLKTYLYF
jgi:hypothetical protein